MNPQADNIVVRHIKADKNTDTKKVNQNPKKPADTKSKTSNNIADNLSKKYQRNIRILAVLLIVISFLILLSLISYTREDEVNTNVNIGDFIRLIRGNEEILVKAQTTHNWLGLIGAVLSNVLYNNTIGYAVIIIPFLITFYSISIFKNFKINLYVVKKSIVLLSFAILFCSFTGVLSNIEFIGGLSKEWSGSVGLFISSLLTSIIGNAGSVIVLLTLFVLLLIFGTKLKFNKLIVFFKYLGEKLVHLYNIIRVKIFKENINSEDNIKNDDNNIVTDIEKNITKPKPSNVLNEDPARIIRRNLDININKATEAKQYPTSLNEVTSDYNDSEQEVKYEQRQAKQNYVKQQEYHQQDFSKNVRQSRYEQEPRYEYRQPEQDFIKPQEFHPQNLSDDLHSNITEKKKYNYQPFYDDTLDKVKKNSNVIQENAVLDNGLVVDEENPSDFEEMVDYEEPVINSFNKDDYDEDYDEESNLEESISLPLIKGYVQQEEAKKLSVISSLESDSLAQLKPLSIELPQKPLIVTVNDPNPDNYTPVNLISTSFLDEYINYTPPSLDLLNNLEEETYIDEQELKDNARILQEKLETFKIYIENLSVTPGPVVTQYEFVPAAGIKISKIESLLDDIAMALKARGIRIIAPIPGKGTVGIEIPNQNPSTVRFASIIKSAKFQTSNFKLPLAFGKTISGEVYCADLAKMPHLLIAGSTGSGKSVGINTIIASLLYKMHPKSLKFVIIDPKKVELKQYGKLENHFLALSPDIDSPIITDPQDAVVVLKAVCAEMDKRYDILADVGQRNLFDYNKNIREGKIKDSKELVHKQMPFLVVVIDELADLMLTASKEVETPIIRLAQLGRAVGIHLIVATQRPSVDVITGIIKANFPARISYLVASRIDSRTILDVMGAEQLLGNGDMLFLAGGTPKPFRIQNSFISTEEVENICEFISNQRGFSQPYMLPSLNESGNSSKIISKEDRDPLFEEAARLIIHHQQGSVSLIQRRLKVGYARAGRIIDELESAGVIGPFDGSKARTVFMESESELEAIL